tara:strand:- start:477 stop:743 length:267 start_codon:yes stop_codon:yes gene_type:complete
MKALIETITPVKRITSWTTETVYGQDQNVPVKEDIANSARIVQMEENEFEVHSNLIWVDCDSSINCLDYYYDKSDSTIKPINHVPLSE